MMPRWYVRRIEALLHELQPEFLLLLREGELTADLQQVSSRSHLVGWEFRRFVDAVQLLLVDVAQVSVGKATLQFPAGSRMLVEPRCALVC